jgi:hypothetical protein
VLERTLKSQNGYTDIHALTLLSSNVIDTLTYNETETSVEARKGTHLRLPRPHHPLKPRGKNWTSITKEEFDEFRINLKYLQAEGVDKPFKYQVTRQSRVSHLPNSSGRVLDVIRIYSPPSRTKSSMIHAIGDPRIKHMPK